MSRPTDDSVLRIYQLIVEKCVIDKFCFRVKTVTFVVHGIEHTGMTLFLSPQDVSHPRRLTIIG